VHSAWKQCADDSCTIQQFAEAIGLLVYASSLLGVDLADFYPAFKCYRRRLAAAGKQQVSPQDKARIWTSVKSNLDQWFQRVATNTPVVPSDDDVPRVVLFTDASNMGYGAVLISEDGTVKYFGKHWSAAVHTSSTQAEVTAVERALTHFKRDIEGRALTLVVDNTSTVFGMRRGHSVNFHVNNRLKFALRALPASVDRDLLRVVFISTMLNPADEGSRGIDPIPEKVVLARDELFGRG
jgi:hypothetical protein